VNTGLDYLAHLAEESSRFVQALDAATPDAPVPTCPDWDADDLLWHLGKVQAFWATVIRQGIVSDKQVGEIKPVRPESRDALFDYFDRVSSELQAVFADVPDDATPAWTWSSDHTVGFIRRRQAHEALIHRIDAEETAGARTSMSSTLCADGVDEILRVMYAGAPPWGTFEPHPSQVVRLTATDTGDSWLVQLGRFTGHDPSEDADVDEADIRVLDDDVGEGAQISATAADLDCWLWHRPTVGRVDRSGDSTTIGAFESVVAFPIN
jgi:uncharacterized protein (TIGR03083 family)